MESWDKVRYHQGSESSKELGEIRKTLRYVDQTKMQRWVQRFDKLKPGKVPTNTADSDITNQTGDTR